MGRIAHLHTLSNTGRWQQRHGHDTTSAFPINSKSTADVGAVRINDEAVQFTELDFENTSRRASASEAEDDIDGAADLEADSAL